MDPKILITLGPSSLDERTVAECITPYTYLFRINLSHTPVSKVESTIKLIQSWTDVPICIDSEGAQIRNQEMVADKVEYRKGEIIELHYEEVIGDERNISFSPKGIAEQFIEGDIIRIDFNSVAVRVIEKNRKSCKAKVINGGFVGRNKAADLNRDIRLEPITTKDRQALRVARQMGVRYFALSFTNRPEDIDEFRLLAGEDSRIISKIESSSGVINLAGILQKADEILIDRGDLSRQLPVEKIPFLQRRIISMARSKGRPVYVATNLLESMVSTLEPTRAEVNDVVSTLLMGSNGLVLAAETAIGRYPVEAVKMICKLIRQYDKWTPNSNLAEILEN